MASRLVGASVPPRASAPATRAVIQTFPGRRRFVGISVRGRVRSFATLVLLASAFLVSGVRAGVAAPLPNLARLVPPNYRVLGVLRSRLSGQPVPEVVVSSVGPLNRYKVHPTELQVFSWDAVAYRWNIVFDAQKVRYPTSPLIDPRADVRIGRIGFVRFVSGARRELVFTTSETAGAGLISTLVVVDFRNAEAAIDYLWSGRWGISFRVAGTAAKRTLVATTAYRTVVDPPSQPVRTYRFTIGLDRGLLRVLHDDRPWVGLSVAGTDRSPHARLGTLHSHLQVLAVIPHSPAATVFHAGDVILGLTPQRTPWKANLLGPALIDQIAAQQAGQRIVFTVHRGAAYLRLPLKLGSMTDPSGPGTTPNLNPNFALI